MGGVRGCRAAGVPRFIFASSIQTINGYPDSVPVPADALPRPESTYACSKLFGEALGRLHADRSGIGVACLRIGAVLRPDEPSLVEESLQGVWCSQHDLARLIVAAVESTAPFATVTAVSPPAASRFDTANPFGWTPTDRPSPRAGA